jgi:hypothetical protein
VLSQAALLLVKRSSRYWAIKVESMSNRVAITQYSYRGPFGEVSHSGRNFFAWQDGHLIGTYRTLEKAMEHLAWKERLKTKPHG